MIQVAIVDDQQLFRESLADVIQSEPAMTCILQCADGGAFLSAIRQPGATLPNIVLLDLEMPGMNGIELHEIIRKEYPEIKVIILSIHANEKLIVSLIKAGINGYISKNCDKEELFRAIHMAHTQGYYINPGTMQAMQRQSESKISMLYNVNNIPITLSKREVEVLRLICKEYSNADIAEELFISSRTVEGHRLSMMQKIGCKSSTGLILFAIRNSIFIPPF